MRPFAVLIFLALAFPSGAQERKAARPTAHARPTPQQIRKFDELEKKKHDGRIRGRSPNSGPSQAKTVRAPSPN